MKKTWIVALSLLFTAVAGFADGPTPAPLSDEALAAILGEPLAGSSCATQTGGTGEAGLAAAVSGEKAIYTCAIFCPNGSQLRCQGSTPCTAAERNCGGLERGHVTCDGRTTSCSPGCCTDGTAQQNACCRCNVTENCVDCCRCQGGTLAQCSQSCG
jgi:hypothetical protein